MKNVKLSTKSKAKKNETSKKTEKVTEEKVSLSIEDLSQVNGGVFEARQQGLCSYNY